MPDIGGSGGGTGELTTTTTPTKTVVSKVTNPDGSVTTTYSDGSIETSTTTNTGHGDTTTTTTPGGYTGPPATPPPAKDSGAPTFTPPDKPAVLDYTPAVLTGDQVAAMDPKIAADIAAKLGITVDELKTQYAGIPVASGYYDASGALITDGQYAYQTLGQAKQLGELANMAGPQGFDQYLQQQGYQSPDLAGMQAKMGSLGDLLGQGPDTAGQQGYAAQQLGFDNYGELQGKLSDLINGSGVMNKDQYNLFMRSTDQQVSQMQRETMQMAEGLGLQSSGRALVALSQMTAQVQDTKLQAQMSYMNYDQATRMTEYQALVNANQKAQGAYADQIYQNRMGALQAYATQFNAAISQRSQYLNEYSTDYQLMVQHADVVYKSIMANIGYSQSQLDQANEKWNMALASYKANWDTEVQRYNADLQKYQLDQQAAQAKTTANNSLFTGVLQILGGVLLTVLGHPLAGIALGVSGAASIGAGASGAATIGKG